MPLRAILGALLSMLAVSALATPPTSKADREPLLVVDAAGKTVGRLSTMGNVPIVYATIDGVLTSFYLGTVQQNGFPDFEKVEPLSAGNQVYFATSNCSGTAYMSYEHGNRAIARQSLVLKYNEENFLYVAEAVSPTEIVLGSVFQTGGCGPTTGTVLGVPLKAPVNLSTKFAEPYGVQ